MSEAIYDLQKVCEILQISFRTGQEMVRSGELPAFRARRKCLITESALKDWIARGGTRMRRRTVNNSAENQQQASVGA